MVSNPERRECLMLTPFQKRIGNSSNYSTSNIIVAYRLPFLYLSVFYTSSPSPHGRRGWRKTVRMRSGKTCPWSWTKMWLQIEIKRAHSGASTSSSLCRLSNCFRGQDDPPASLSFVARASPPGTWLLRRPHLHPCRRNTAKYVWMQRTNTEKARKFP